MSRKSVVKAVVTLETKPLAQEMDGILHAIGTGVIDVQTINTFKRLVSPKSPPTTSITISTSQAKSNGLASSRTKKTTRTTLPTCKKVVLQEPFPNPELVSAVKTVVMKSLTALATEADSRTKKAEATDGKTTRQAVSQGTRNVGVCCRLALEVLRQWQDHVDIGTAWANKAYFGYINKLIALEMVIPRQTVRY
jgi:hypothetical protein